MSGLVNDSTMESEDKMEQIVDIYISAEAVRDMKHKKDTDDLDNQTKKIQTPQHTGNNSANSRNSTGALVCLVLLCFLLLMTVILLSVYTYTNNTNFTQERRRLLTNITNLTEDREQLITRNDNLTEQKDEMICKIFNLTKERDVLIQNNINLTSERDQLKLKSENLTKKIQLVDGWTYDQFKFYYMSNKTKNMSESRTDCKDRGADLIIINNQQEQDFVFRLAGNAMVWIGLTDNEVENTWKWVDGSTMTPSSWANKEPNGDNKQNCVVSADKPGCWNHLSGWIDVSCNELYQWICEMNISQFIKNLRNN